MTPTYDLLLARLTDAFAQIEPGADPVLRGSERADYQANGVMALAKRVGRPPREVAEAVARTVELDDVAEVEVAGAGFLNLTLRPAYLSRALGELAGDARLGVAPARAPHRVVIDYSSPNVAKVMHVGHLRTTVIGDALARMYRFAGHEVIARNHIGDWGTPFGMLIEQLVDVGEAQALASLEMGDLNEFNRVARAKFDADDAFKERSRRRVVALQGGDPETLRLWRVLVDRSVRYLGEVYATLDITLGPDDIAGESSYNRLLEGVVRDLTSAGLLIESGGALCAFPQGFTNREGEPLPLIVQKSDEGFGYAATDLAALRERVTTLGARELLYVVGAPQAQHFAMVFEVAREAGWLPGDVRCEHVAFGNVLGPDRKMLKSRSGESVKLATLLDEAIDRAGAALDARHVQMDRAERDHLARQVARAAIKYADLSTDRSTDYVFDLDRMLAFEGDTGPYLQYAHARLRSILRRAGTVPIESGVAFALATREERRLATSLLAFPEAFDAALATLQPHRLCTYLFDLAQRLAAFYDACPVLSAEGATRTERLALCDMTARTLSLGLSVLGIEAPERM